MTTLARTVLEDCRAEIADLDTCEEGSEWRRRWTATVALLRAVGHVLSKSDSLKDPDLTRVIKEQYDALRSTKPEPEIFWKFIEEERNSILKQYRFSDRLLASGVAVSSISVSNPVTGDVTARNFPLGADEVHLRVMSGGPFAGREVVGLATQAADWWEQYLDRIDESVAKEKAR